MLIDFLYQEYARISERWDKYAISSFDDFKYLAALGAVMGWLPLGKSIEAEGWVLLSGFLAILFIVAVIGTRDLLKQSICYFYGKQLRCYENAIRRSFGDGDATFLLAAHWAKWSQSIHRQVGAYFYLLFGLIIVLFPSIVLWRVLSDSSDSTLRYVYPVVAAIVSVFPIKAARSLYLSELARPCPVEGHTGTLLRCRACSDVD